MATEVGFKSLMAQFGDVDALLEQAAHQMYQLVPETTRDAEHVGRTLGFIAAARRSVNGASDALRDTSKCWKSKEST